MNRRDFLKGAAAALATVLGGGMMTRGARASERPSFVFLISDDIGWNDYGCYGNTVVRTPNIDRLAARGIQFSNAFLTASSCSPSRASMITGRYPHSLGEASELHRPIAPNLPWFPERLRAAGYHTVLAGKCHMKKVGRDEAASNRDAFAVFDKSSRVEGNSGGHANWVKHLAERPTDKPFFMWYAAFDAHRDWDGTDEWNASLYGPAHNPEDVIVPPFLVNDQATRRDLASYYDEVTRFDHFVGEVVSELERQGVLDNTVVMVLSDNGRPFPRAKTRLHDSGMKTALVMHWPEGIRGPGAVCDSLVSSVDLAPTILELAGLPRLETFQGVSLAELLNDPSQAVRDYAFSEHNWHDYEAHGRSVRHRGYLYIVNRRREQAWQGPADSVRSPSHQALRRKRDAGELSAAQADVFMAPRPEEELYYTPDDPHQLTNLVDDSAHADVLNHLRDVMEQWQSATGDSVPENYSRDFFDRETGRKLSGVMRKHLLGEPAGQEHDAHLNNVPGPILRQSRR